MPAVQYDRFVIGMTDDAAGVDCGVDKVCKLCNNIPPNKSAGSLKICVLADSKSFVDFSGTKPIYGRNYKQLNCLHVPLDLGTRPGHYETWD